MAQQAIVRSARQRAKSAAWNGNITDSASWVIRALPRPPADLPRAQVCLIFSVGLMHCRQSPELASPPRAGFDAASGVSLATLLRSPSLLPCGALRGASPCCRPACSTRRLCESALGVCAVGVGAGAAGDSRYVALACACAAVSARGLSVDTACSRLRWWAKHRSAGRCSCNLHCTELPSRCLS